MDSLKDAFESLQTKLRGTIDDFEQSLKQTSASLLYENVNIDAEHNIPPHKYITSHPLIQVNPVVYEDSVSCEDLEASNFWLVKGLDDVAEQTKLCAFKQLKQPICASVDHRRYVDITDQIKLLTYERILKSSEYIIFALVYPLHNITTIRESAQHYGNGQGGHYTKHTPSHTQNILNIVYITNYGRFINISTTFYVNTYADTLSGDQPYCSCSAMCIFQEKLKGSPYPPFHYAVFNYKIYVIEAGCLKTYGIAPSGNQICTDSISLDAATLPPLTFKMPILFLDVIKATRDNSTEGMQACCEAYYGKLMTIKTLQERNHVLEETVKKHKDDTQRFRALETELFQSQSELSRYRLIEDAQDTQIATLKAEIANLKALYGAGGGNC